MPRTALAGAALLMIVTGSVPQSAHAVAQTMCTLAVEAETGHPLVNEGDCTVRQSPASTFKIPISLMGFDAGILTSPTSPELPFEEGYIAWRPEWKQATTPERWMRHSVVWYSQRVMERLGMERVQGYMDRFAYGNGDLSGDPGKNNGLTHAWLSSSLRLSPADQVAFLRKLVGGSLPVSAEAARNTALLLEQGTRGDGWQVFGKTGSGLPHAADGTVIKGQPFGWFVGWAEKGERTVVFARLVQHTDRPDRPPGPLARDAVFADLFGADSPLE